MSYVSLKQQVKIRAAGDRLAIQDKLVMHLKWGNGEPNNQPSPLPPHLRPKLKPVRAMSDTQWNRFLKDEAKKL